MPNVNNDIFKQYDKTLKLIYADSDFADLSYFSRSFNIDPFTPIGGYEAYYTRPSIALGVIYSTANSKAFKETKEADKTSYKIASASLYDVIIISSPHDDYRIYNSASYKGPDGSTILGNRMCNIPALSSLILNTAKKPGDPTGGIYVPYASGTIVLIAFPGDSFNYPVIIGSVSDQFNLLKNYQYNVHVSSFNASSKASAQITKYICDYYFSGYNDLFATSSVEDESNKFKYLSGYDPKVISKPMKGNDAHQGSSEEALMYKECIDRPSFFLTRHFLIPLGIHHANIRQNSPLKNLELNSDYTYSGIGLIASKNSIVSQKDKKTTPFGDYGYYPINSLIKLCTDNSNAKNNVFQEAKKYKYNPFFAPCHSTFLELFDEFRVVNSKRLWRDDSNMQKYIVSPAAADYTYLEKSNPLVSFRYQKYLTSEMDAHLSKALGSLSTQELYNKTEILKNVKDEIEDDRAKIPQASNNHAAVMIKAYGYDKKDVKNLKDSNYGLTIQALRSYVDKDDKSNVKYRTVNIYSSKINLVAGKTTAIFGRNVNILSKSENAKSKDVSILSKNISSYSWQASYIVSGETGNNSAMPLILEPGGENKLWVDNVVCFPTKSSQYAIVYTEKSNTSIINICGTAYMCQTATTPPVNQPLNVAGMPAQTFSLQYCQNDMLTGDIAIQGTSKTVQVKSSDNKTYPLMLIDSTIFPANVLKNSAKFIYQDVMTNPELKAMGYATVQKSGTETVLQPNYKLAFLRQDTNGSQTVYSNDMRIATINSLLAIFAKPYDTFAIAKIGKKQDPPSQKKYVDRKYNNRPVSAAVVAQPGAKPVGSSFGEVNMDELDAGVTGVGGDVAKSVDVMEKMEKENAAREKANKFHQADELEKGKMLNDDLDALDNAKDRGDLQLDPEKADPTKSFTKNGNNSDKFDNKYKYNQDSEIISGSHNESKIADPDEEGFSPDADGAKSNKGNDKKDDEQGDESGNDLIADDVYLQDDDDDPEEAYKKLRLNPMGKVEDTRVNADGVHEEKVNGIWHEVEGNSGHPDRPGYVDNTDKVSSEKLEENAQKAREARIANEKNIKEQPLIDRDTAYKNIKISEHREDENNFYKELYAKYPDREVPKTVNLGDRILDDSRDFGRMTPYEREEILKVDKQIYQQQKAIDPNSPETQAAKDYLDKHTKIDDRLSKMYENLPPEAFY